MILLKRTRACCQDPRPDVRALRAAKFAGRLGFTCDDALENAIRTTADDLSKASTARILEELYKLLSGHGSEHAFRLLESWGCLGVLLPEITPLPEDLFDALQRLGELSGGARDGVSQALMLAVLLAPLAVRALQARPVGSDHEAEVRIGEAIRPVVERMSVARRDSTIARECLAAQVRFLDAPVRRGSRRFCFRPFFHDAMTLRKLLGPIEDLPEGEPDPFLAWVEMSEKLGAEDGESPPQDRPRGRRRRRRGGRRRRRKPSGPTQKDGA